MEIHPQTNRLSESDQLGFAFHWVCESSDVRSYLLIERLCQGAESRYSRLGIWVTESLKSHLVHFFQQQMVQENLKNSVEVA